MMRLMGQNPTDAEDWVNSLDAEGNATVDFSESLTAMTRKVDPSNKDEILEAFKALDKDGSGFVSTAELKFVMNNLGGYPPWFSASHIHRNYIRGL